MIKNKYKKQHRRYVPPKTNHHKKKKKKHDFVSKGQGAVINKEGIKMESSAVKQKNIICIIGFIIAIILLFFGIKDDTILFEGFGVKLSCTLAGTFVFFFFGIGFFFNKPKVKIEK